jgi:hypothetical protein
MYTEYEGTGKEEVVFQSGYRIASTSSTLLMFWVRPWYHCLYHFRTDTSIQYGERTDPKPQEYTLISDCIVFPTFHCLCIVNITGT